MNMRHFERDENDDEEFNPFFDLDGETDDEDDEMDEELSEEYVKLLEKQTAIETVQLELVQAELNIRVLNMTVKMLERSFWWRFRSPASKLGIITSSYVKMMGLLYKQNELNEKE